MGNHLAPPIAILFISSLEIKALESFERRPLLYKRYRYIGDIFVIWHHGRELFDRFVQHFNVQHPNIQFTVDHSDTPTRSVSLLDLTISVGCSVLNWEVFTKLSHSGVHLSFLSSIPLAMKPKVAKNQFTQSLEVSTPEGRECGKEKICQLLMNNDYPSGEKN